MKASIQAAKTQDAVNRAQAAAAALADRHGLDAELVGRLGATHREPGIVLLRRMEGIADILDALVEAQPAAPASTKRKKAAAEGRQEEEG